MTARKFLQSKIIGAENNLRGLLRNFGMKVGAITRAQFEARVMELLEERPHLIMAAPSVGQLVALTFRTAVDEVARFRRAPSVAAHFGLRPARYQSGELDRGRGISKCSDAGVR